MKGPITRAQIKAIASMCSYAHIGKEAKAIMVEGFSGGRCSSTTGLQHDEATDMIRHLYTLQPSGAETEKMKGKIMYYAHEMRWTKLNDKGKVVADGKRIDEWMSKYSYLKKKMNLYTYEELPKLVSQFELIYKSYLNKI